MLRNHLRHPILKSVGVFSTAGYFVMRWQNMYLHSYHIRLHVKVCLLFGQGVTVGQQQATSGTRTVCLQSHQTLPSRTARQGGKKALHGMQRLKKGAKGKGKSRGKKGGRGPQTMWKGKAWWCGVYRGGPTT